MSKLSGAFNQFKNLNNISPDSINKWLRIKKDPQFLLNFLGNRILYPQTIPVSPLEMEIDLAILREALKIDSEKFYNKERQEIEVPEQFLLRFVPELKLLAAVIDGIKPPGVVKILLKKVAEKKTLATSYNPAILKGKDLVEVSIENRSFKLLPNTLTLIPCKGGQLTLKIDGKEPIKFDPGEIGIFVDLRKK